MDIREKVNEKITEYRMKKAKERLHNRKERRTKEERIRELRKKYVIGGGVVLLLILVIVLAVSLKGKGKDAESANAKGTDKTSTEPADGQSAGGEGSEDADKERLKDVSLTISAAGDCTLGTDEFFDWSASLPAKYEETGDPAYFFKNVQPIFAADDLTIINFEGTLTESEDRQDKQFAFKAEPSYAKIVTAGAIEAANLANNHSHDYGDQSYTDTMTNLEAEGITTFGYDRTAVADVKGVKVGLLGTYVLAEGLEIKDSMIANINSLREQGADLIIASFHWGTEKSYEPDEVQIELAHAAIDNGADLVLGHHPHVLEGIEVYKGKNIVYSLGNFCFGGNSSPSDMNTIIFQQTFTFKDGKLAEDNTTNIIPCSISSADGYNNYQPTPAEGELKDDILSRLAEYNSMIPGNNGSSGDEESSSESDTGEEE